MVLYRIMVKPFYKEGLYFSCTRCSACCRYESGYVFLTQNDVAALALECQMSDAQFIETYCRWIPSEGNTERLSLREKSDFDCIFWGSGCKVYHARPLQCRAFPFWPNVLAFKGSWKQSAADCPGINQGKLHSAEEIEAFLKDQESEPVVTRNRRGL